MNAVGPQMAEIILVNQKLANFKKWTIWVPPLNIKISIIGFCMLERTKIKIIVDKQTIEII